MSAEAGTGDVGTRLGRLEATSPLHCMKIEDHDKRLRLLEGQVVRLTTLVTIGSAVGGVVGSIIIRLFVH